MLKFYNYGSSKELVISELKKGKNVLFDIDWQGIGKLEIKIKI